MNRKSIALGMALGFIVFGAGSGAAQPQLKGRVEFSGTFVNADFDVNKDGLKAGYNVEGAKGSFGPGQITSVVEFVFDPVADCPAGNNGFTLATEDASGNPVDPWQSVTRLDSTGDLIIFQYAAATSCVDTDTSVQAFTNDLEVTGGTGRFEGATGTAFCEGTAVTRIFDADGNYFGEQSGTCELTIDLH